MNTIKNTSTKDEDRLAKFLVGLLIIPIGMSIWTWVSLDLYRWFVLPDFPMLPTLSFVSMMGIRIFVSSLVVGAADLGESSRMNSHKLIFVGWALAFTLWLVGWLLHKMM